MPDDTSSRLPSVLRAVFASFRFEALRSFSWPRLSTWALLVMFPVVIVGVIRNIGGTADDRVLALMFFLLIPESLCLLALLLWVAPHLQSELDGKTWPYLAVRPYGRLIVFFGKYLNGVAWAAAAGIASLSLSVAIASIFLKDTERFWLSLAAIVVMSSFGYGALYALFGVLIPKRSILIAVGYTLIGELLVGTLPAVVSEVTLQFHLRCLLKIWVQFDVSDNDARLLFSSAPAWQHLAIYAGMVVTFLSLGAAIVQRREYSIQDEA